MRSGSIGAAPGVRPDATPPELPGRHVLGVIHARAGQLPPGAASPGGPLGVAAAPEPAAPLVPGEG